MFLKNGGYIMKKELKFEQALKLLKRGEAVDCQLSDRSDNVETVLTEDRLRYLYDLSLQKVQLCKMYKVVSEKVKIPENAIEMSFDEAYEMSYAGEVIYYQENGEEQEVATLAELMRIRTEFNMQGKKLFLYWHE